MGKVMSVISRKVNRFNVENRAHRVLDREKPAIAPTYNTAIQDRQRTLEADPGYIERESKRDPSLNERLKQVFVTSKDTYYSIDRQNTAEKPLPTDKATVEDFEYGFMEPRMVSRGRCTLRQAMKFITDSQGDPDNWTPEKIAEDYKLKRELVDNILEHFKSFQIYLPDNTAMDSKLAQSKQNLIEKSGSET